MQYNGIITLLTDFGTIDGYVATMKGVILGIAPQARIIDYTHDVEPQAISGAAYLLQAGYRYFPPGTIHVAVVDPGVGSDRRAIAVATGAACFIGPDNGLLGPVIDDARREHGRVDIIELTESRWWLPNLSHTFHGRDIFAPVAAHLLNGAPFADLGRPIDRALPSVIKTPRLDRSGLRGQIVHVDRFGNCITNITRDHLEFHGFGTQIIVEIADQRVPGLYAAYSHGPVGALVTLLGSSGHLELAVRNDSAARMLGVIAGDPLRVTQVARTLARGS